MESRILLVLAVLLAPSCLVPSALYGAPRSIALQSTDVQPLAGAPSASAAKQSDALASSGMQPAPMPNPDFDPPHGDGTTIPNLTPALLSARVEFQGNGFSNASSLAYGQDQRSKPAAGLNWSVPVK